MGNIHDMLANVILYGIRAVAFVLLPVPSLDARSLRSHSFLEVK